MTWGKAKTQIEFTCNWIVKEHGYLEPRATWTDRGGVIEAGIVGSAESRFAIHMDHHDGATFVGIVRPGEEMRDVRPCNVDGTGPVKERSFRVNRNDAMEMSRLSRALKVEVQAYRAIRDAEVVETVGNDLAGRVQAIVDADPDAAGATLAALLKQVLKAPEMVALAEAVEAAAPGHGMRR